MIQIHSITDEESYHQSAPLTSSKKERKKEFKNKILSTILSKNVSLSSCKNFRQSGTSIVSPPKMGKKERRKEREKKNRDREQVDFPQWQRRYRTFEKAINISANQRIHKACSAKAFHSYRGRDFSTIHSLSLSPYALACMRIDTRIRGLLTVLRAASMIYRGRRAPQASLETSLETRGTVGSDLSNDRPRAIGWYRAPYPSIRRSAFHDIGGFGGFIRRSMVHGIWFFK